MAYGQIIVGWMASLMYNFHEIVQIVGPSSNKQIKVLNCEVQWPLNGHWAVVYFSQGILPDFTNELLLRSNFVSKIRKYSL